jgi:hypothetical protein
MHNGLCPRCSDPEDLMARIQQRPRPRPSTVGKTTAVRWWMGKLKQAARDNVESSQKELPPSDRDV